MEIPATRPKIETVLHQLIDLEQAGKVARTVIESVSNTEASEDLEVVIYHGYSTLIDSFNEISENDLHSDILSNVVKLKSY